jgi:hypothetical protein
MHTCECRPPERGSKTNPAAAAADDEGLVGGVDTGALDVPPVAAGEEVARWCDREWVATGC